MRNSFILRFQQIIPSCLVILAVIVDQAMPATTVFPIWSYILIFYWAVYRPVLVPIVLLFFFGIAVDITTGTILGETSFLLLFVYGSALILRKFLTATTFNVMWICFGLVLGVLFFLQWGWIALTYNYTYSILSFIERYAITWMLYPWVSFLLNKIQR